MSDKIYTEVATAPSHSSPGKHYVIKRDEDGNLSCNCPAWLYGKGSGWTPNNRACKHTRAYQSGSLEVLKIDHFSETDLNTVAGDIRRFIRERKGDDDLSLTLEKLKEALK